MRAIISRLRNLPDVSQLAWCWVTVSAVFSAAAAVVHLFIELSHDTYTLTYQTQKMLAGMEPYVDFSDTNPPLVHLLYAVPVALAQWSGWPVYPFLNGLALLAVIVALLLSDRLLRDSRSTRLTRAMVASTLAFALLVLSFIHQVFADREHLIMVLIAPWLLLYSPLVEREAVPRRWRIAAAALAGIGFALKPYAYVIYVAVVGFVVCFERPLRRVVCEVEHYIIAAVALLYFAVIFVFFHAYLSIILPLAWQTYDAYRWSLQTRSDVITLLLCSYVLFAAVLWKGAPGFWNRTISYLFVMLLGAMGAFLLSSGWYYTRYLFIAVGWVLTIAAAQRLSGVWSSFSVYRQLCLSVPLLAMVYGMGYHFLLPTYRRVLWDSYSQIIYGFPSQARRLSKPTMDKFSAYLDTHPRYLLLTTNIFDTTLLKEGTARESVGRFNHLWMLPGIIRTQNPSSYLALHTEVAGYLAENLEKQRPDTVIIDVSPDRFRLPQDYDILQFFQSDEKFARAWAMYDWAGTIDDCKPLRQRYCAYTIYYRRAP